jgi:hypothetical protein
MCRLSKIPGSLNLLEPTGPVQGLLYLYLLLFDINSYRSAYRLKRTTYLVSRCITVFCDVVYVECFICALEFLESGSCTRENKGFISPLFFRLLRILDVGIIEYKSCRGTS